MYPDIEMTQLSRYDAPGNDIIDDILGECKKAGEMCVADNINVMKCCEGLECTGFPFPKCQQPSGRNDSK